MDKSAIILACGYSSTLKDDVGVVELEGKPLLNYVVDVVKGLVDEIIIVASSQEIASVYAKIVSSPKARVIVDEHNSSVPLNQALTGFKAANGDYSLLLPVTTPFVSREVVSLLLDLSVGKTATVPRRTSNEVEPLCAVYKTKEALKAAEEALAQDENTLDAMVGRLRGVRYISTLVIEQLDPDLRAFFNVNSAVGLKKAATLLRQKRKGHKQEKFKPF